MAKQTRTITKLARAVEGAPCLGSFLMELFCHLLAITTYCHWRNPL